MNKKLLTALAGGVALTFGVAGILLVAGDSLKAAIAEEETHVHTATCNIHHYAEIAPTSAKAGVKEYWICCDDPGHKVVFAAPTIGNISDAAHGEGFAVEDTDDRYIAPYTFPEVFMTKYAYSDGVTFADGKATAASGSLYFKGSVLKEAYSLGYTHMRFHSKAEGDDAVQVLGTQDDWKNYSKRYADDNDNRYWLKSFSDNNAGLKIDSQNSDGNHVNTTLTLSDFHLYKSSVTESWGGGDMTSWKGTAAANRYIAYEDGELVADNAGGNNYNGLIEIPAELMGSKADYTKPEYRAFYVKVLAQGYSSGVGANDRVVIGNNDNTPVGYSFSRTSGSGETPTQTADGFISPLYGGFASNVGLNYDAYHDGALSIGLDYTGAIAIRLNYDFKVAWVQDGITYSVLPLANTADGDMRLSLTNINYSGTAASQMNVPLPKSVNHKGIKLKMFTATKPASNFALYNYAITAKLVAFSVPEPADGLYTIDAGEIALSAGCAIVVRFDTSETLTNASITFQYSWID